MSPLHSDPGRDARSSPSVSDSNIVILGGGAIGSIIAAYLAGAVRTATIVDGWGEHVAAINQSGLTVDGVRGVTHAYPHAIGLSDQPMTVVLPVDAIFFACKSQDTRALLAVASTIVSPETVIVSTQNGMNEEILADAFGAEQVVAAVTELGGYLAGPGRVIETRADGGFVIGDWSPTADGRRRARIGALMQRCARTEVSSSIRGLLWSKLWWNCMLNPLTAITGLGQGRVLADRDLRVVAFAIGQEVARTAQTLSIPLEDLKYFGVSPAKLIAAEHRPMPVDAWEEVAERYGDQLDKGTSMARDIGLGRPTEVDSLNGYVADKAGSLSGEAPLNKFVVDIVHAIERGELQQGRETAAPLVELARGTAARD